MHSSDLLVADTPTHQNCSAVDTPAAIVEKMTRTFAGAVLVFETGAAVTKASLPSDFSSVHISKLAHESSQDSVRAFLQSRGLDASKVVDIRIIRGERHASAVVRVEDPEFARQAAIKLGSQVVSREGFVVSSDSSALRVDCKKVHCSWHKPFKTVWLNFGNGEIRDRVCKKFKDGTYQVLGQQVSCSTSNANPNFGRGGHVFNAVAWTLCLTEVPGAASEGDITKAIHSQSDKPRHIELGLATYEVDAESCSAMIQSLFTAIGLLEYWELTPDTTGKRMKAGARFQDEDDARNAVQKLNNTELPFSKKAKLTVQLVHSAKFKVSTAIYDAVESQIKGHIRGWKLQHLYFVVYPNSDPPKWYRVLKVEGEDVKTVVQAKNTISNILAGTVATDDSCSSVALWHPLLRAHGPLLETISRLQTQTGVTILRNKAKSQLRLYGPPNQYQQVQTALCTILKGIDSAKEFTIELNNETFYWACHGGFKRIEVELGPNKAIFDIIQTPKRIVITGTATEYETAMAILDGRQIVTKLHELPGGPTSQDCSVCWTEAECPIRTQCGHVYCLDCFENMCNSATSQDSDVLIRCAGDSGKCQVKLGLPDLQEHLSSTSFEELLESSFASYMRRRPHLFRYCPSPDCGYVYRVSEEAQIHTCANCLVTVCTKCHEQHGTMTCADYKDVQSGGYEAFERLKKKMGFKGCPKCGMHLEKIDGCNHITCQCGAHICWVCLETFQVSDDCYQHMREKHGGIGLEDLQRQFG